MSKSKGRTETKPLTSRTVDNAREMMIRLGCPDLFAPDSSTPEDENHSAPKRLAQSR